MLKVRNVDKIDMFGDSEPLTEIQNSFKQASTQHPINGV